MCNDYEQQVAYQAFVDMMQAEALTPDPAPGWSWRTADDIRIGDSAPVVRTNDHDRHELTDMKFGWPSPRPKGGPVFNFRSEGRRFVDSNRCLIPASAFFEFTGTKYPKAKHRFTMADGQPFCIAGLWRLGEGNQPNAFAMLTTEPGPDVAPIHDRQIVVLPRGLWLKWLDLTVPEADILRALPAGSLNVEQVRAGA